MAVSSKVTTMNALRQLAFMGESVQHILGAASLEATKIVLKSEEMKLEPSRRLSHPAYFV